jgi:hypothetical protein
MVVLSIGSIWTGSTRNAGIRNGRKRILGLGGESVFSFQGES